MAAGCEIFQKTREPKHSRVRDFVLEQMAIGRLRVGDPLPPEGTIAESLGVGRNTVRHAFAELVRQGFIERHRGRTAFVTRVAQPRRAADMAVFGLILPTVRGSLYPSLIKGFGEIAGELRHSLTICETGNDIARQSDAILQMIDRRAIGVAMVPTTEGIPPYQLRQLEERGIPVVLCHRGIENTGAAVIAWSWEKVGRIAAEEIVKHGHRRVAFIACMRSFHTKLQEDAFRKTLAAHGIELPADMVKYHEQFTASSCDGEAKRMLTNMLLAKDRPTAIFVNDLVVAERVYHEAIHLGLRIPESLSIVAFGGKWREGVIRQQLCAVAVDEVELGKSAAKVLARLQATPSEIGRQQQIEIPLEFIAAKSLAPPQ